KLRRNTLRSWKRSASILQIRSTLGFAATARGYCYYLQGRSEITKAQFDAAQKLIGDCRKDGSLPYDICATDEPSAVIRCLKMLSASRKSPVRPTSWGSSSSRQAPSIRTTIRVLLRHCCQHLCRSTRHVNRECEVVATRELRVNAPVVKEPHVI